MKNKLTQLYTRLTSPSKRQLESIKHQVVNDLVLVQSDKTGFKVITFNREPHKTYPWNHFDSIQESQNELLFFSDSKLILVLPTNTEGIETLKQHCPIPIN